MTCPAPSTAKAFTTGVLLVAGACQSVAWSPVTSTETWHSLPLRESTLAGVVAASEAGAGEVYRRYETVVAAMAGAGLGTPVRPLLVVVEADDALPCGDAATSMGIYARWQGSADPARPRFRSMKDLSPAEEVLLADFAVRMVAVRAPIDAPELGLPAGWRRDFAWVVVVPSDSCLDAVSAGMLDFAMEKEGVGWAKRLLMAPFLPMVRSRMVAMLQATVNRCLVTAALAGRTDLDPAAVRSCLQALELPEQPAASELQGTDPAAIPNGPAPGDPR